MSEADDKEFERAKKVIDKAIEDLMAEGLSEPHARILVASWLNDSTLGKEEQKQ